MITSKHLPLLISVFVCLALLICCLMFYSANAFEHTAVPEYQNRLFGENVITLEIQVDPKEWQDMLDNAMAKEWISGDIIINGERFNTVGIRTKGNSSLTTLARSESDRYSLQFKFNKYVKGQTYYGLDSFCVNNLMGDATYMKDYLSYEIMDFVGVTSPLTNFADVTVNGEGYGFFVAIERYDKAFLDRVYNTSSGQLYNVKMSMDQPGAAPEGQPNLGGFAPDRMPQLPQFEEDFSPDAMPQFGENVRPDPMAMPNLPGGFAMGQQGMGNFGGGSLIYTDDDIDSYSAIFENATFNKITASDKQRVITALKNLNEGTNLETYFDVDQILRYFAAHTVVVNLDSYISNMQQNYYLYEDQGKVTILPWDYNLAFGGFQSGNATSIINFPIDTPVSGVNMEDRPLLNSLLEVPEYKERYHEYLRYIVEGYFESGLYESSIMALDQKINAYVKADASAFFSYEQYESSLPELIEWGILRAQSIKEQLEGTIPSTSAGQSANREALIDASSLDLAVLGTMMGGREGMRGEFDAGQFPTAPGQRMERGEMEAQPGNAQFDRGQMEQFGQMPEGEGFPARQAHALDEAPNQTLTNTEKQYGIVIVLLLVLLIGAIVVIARPRKNML